ncbi:MAG TPA: sigma-54 dependent transcriptional regulator [Clostridia bacterium]|nr:sigma-54 dependent transcriptional regulator [Clostridia bacterium]
MIHVLVVDDEVGIRQSLSGVLEDEGYRVSAAETGEQALAMISDHHYDVVLLDIWLPGIDGLEVLEAVKSVDERPEVVMISGHGTIETAVRATKLGAFDFLEKPLSVDKTLIVVKNAAEARKLRSENSDLKRQVLQPGVIVGDSIPMKALRQQIALMAPTNGRVLIFGESGTGKELVARAIHAQSQRKDAMFVEVNCAAIPEDLIESELFGHTRGAFPGATTEKEGKFQKSDGGTLFLDEVGDMSLKTQSKVLRVLDEGRFTPVGLEEAVTVDARVIAATNKDLEDEISRGNFREDLFYRLNVVPFFVPPLRERKEDIPLLARYFLKELSAQYSRRSKEMTDDAVEVLMRYSWPGNVRELRNVIERVVIMNPTVHKLDRKHLPPLLYREGSRKTLGEFSTLHQARAAYERDYILKKLDENHGNVSRTAEVLGLERSHMYRKMKALGIAVKE